MTLLTDIATFIRTRRHYATTLEQLRHPQPFNFDRFLDGNPIENKASLVAATEWLNEQAARIDEARQLIQELDRLIDAGEDVKFTEWSRTRFD